MTGTVGGGRSLPYVFCFVNCRRRSLMCSGGTLGVTGQSASKAVYDVNRADWKSWESNRYSKLAWQLFSGNLGSGENVEEFGSVSQILLVGCHFSVLLVCVPNKHNRQVHLQQHVTRAPIYARIMTPIITCRRRHLDKDKRRPPYRTFDQAPKVNQ